MTSQQPASGQRADQQQKPPGRAMQTLLLVLGAWTLFAPLGFAGLLYAMFEHDSGGSGAAIAYITLAYGAVVVTLGGLAFLSVLTLISAFVVREQRPQLFWTGLAAAPTAVVFGLALTWWLLGKGNLL
jgi:hypothetical protein